MIRTLIADDHAIVRGGLKQIIATSTDIVVTSEATHGLEAVNQLRTCDVDLLVLDMTMPGISGLDLIRRVQAEWPALPILVLSIHDEAQVASRALLAGAKGYVTKDSDPDALLAAIRKVASGGRFIDPTLADAIIFATHSANAPPHQILSDREFQVLQLLATGRSANKIAEALALSAKTISSHKIRLMQKLGCANNVELVRYAIRHGLVAE